METLKPIFGKDQLQEALEFADTLIQATRKLIVPKYRTSNSVCSTKPLTHEQVSGLIQFAGSSKEKIVASIAMKFTTIHSIKKLKKGNEVYMKNVREKFDFSTSKGKEINDNLVSNLVLLSALIGTDTVMKVLEANSFFTKSGTLKKATLNKDIFQDMLSEIGEGDTLNAVVDKIQSMIAGGDGDSIDGNETSEILSKLF